MSHVDTQRAIVTQITGLGTGFIHVGYHSRCGRLFLDLVTEDPERALSLDIEHVDDLIDALRITRDRALS